MIEIKDKKDCCGCWACKNVCPVQCISMPEDAEGFRYPTVDKDKCINCHLCEKVCPIIHAEADKPNEKQRAYLLQHKDKEVLLQSASGGAFAAAVRVILSQGGVAVGAAYNDDMTVSHHIIDRLKDLSQLQSSKYVQSNTAETFKSVKKLLRDGRTVLYSGTPCQIAGLKGFLRKDYDNLYTMDVICHGVASPKLFAKYMEWLGGKMGGKIIYYDFRDKSTGWGLDYMTKTMPCSLDPYYYHFLKGNTYRECCYHCLYARQERVSDITIEDYWGVEKEHPEFYSTKGVSCLLVNTKKGKFLWNLISSEFISLESIFDKVARANHNLKAPTPRPAIRDNIYKQIDELPVNEYFASCMKVPFNIKARIKSMLPGWLKVFIKK